MKRVTYTIAIGLFAVALAFLAVTYPMLPDRPATHFDAQGHPNGWMTKNVYCVLIVILGLFLNGLMLIAIPWIDKRLPDELVNVPWKRYWFATPERREQLRERNCAMMALWGIWANLVLLICIQITYQENVPQPLFRIPIGLGIIILLTLAFLCVVAIFPLMKPPKE